MWFKYPYTNYSELNLDWFLSQFKELLEAWDAQKVDYEQFKLDVTTEFNTLSGKFDDLKDAFDDLYDYVHDYFDDLDVQQEINNKLNQMAADGSLSALIQPLFNEYKEEIDDEIEGQDQRIAVLEGRMDTFASLTEGSTTGDAELMDIRVAADGETYPSAGDAVRGQVDDLQDEIDDLNDMVFKTEVTPGFTELASIPDIPDYYVAPQNANLTGSASNPQNYSVNVTGSITSNTRFGLGAEQNPTIGKALAATSQLRFKITGDSALTNSANVVVMLGACSEDTLTRQNFISTVTTKKYTTDKEADGWYYMDSATISGYITDLVSTPYFYVQGIFFRAALGDVSPASISIECQIASNDDITAYGWNLPSYKNVKEVLDEKADRSEAIGNSTQALIGSNALRFGKYYDHIFSEGASGNSVKVPFESVYHLRISKRLGFSVFEMNAHKLSDGNYLVMHGSSSFGYPSFGNSVYHVDGETVVNDIAFSSVTLAWVKENIRYKCNYPKFKTAPSSLDEMLYECRTLGIIPMIQLDGSTFEDTKPQIDLCNKIMGKDNYILYIKPGGVDSDTRSYTSAWFFAWKSPSDITDVESFIETYKPMIYGISNYNEFSTSDLKDIVDLIHENGCLISSAYLDEYDHQYLSHIGFDIFASNHEIPYMNSGNICNLAGDLAFTDFSTNGTVSNAELTLTAGQTITVPETYDSIYLGGGTMQLVFTGDIGLSMGSHINNVALSSDGSSVNVFTTYFFNERPSFTITAVSTTKISLITFNASKF